MKTPNASQPSSARIYDYFLGGTDNYAVDREAAEMFAAGLRNAPGAARATRGVVLRAARYLAEQGITQFLDIGAGLPTAPNVHEIVRSVQPDARVVYVDNDPIVIAKGQALRDEPGVITVEGDLRKPGAILTHPDVTGLLDFSQPVGVLTIAIWHFLDDDVLAPAQAELRAGLAPGSMLALTHGTSETLTPAEVEASEAVYAQTTNPVHARGREEIAALLEGFEIVEPGLVPLHEWRPQASGDPYPERAKEAYAGVGILRPT